MILFNFPIFITIWNKEALTAKSKITDFQYELLIFLFYLELAFLALDTLLYFSENRYIILTILLLVQDYFWLPL